MKKLLIILLLAFAGCTSENDFKVGKKQLENQGYTDVKNTGYNAWCCSEKETFSTGFVARAKDGSIVKGCFCSNGIKGITIRYEE